MHERPQGALFEALRQLGYSIDSAGDKLPAIIQGAGPRPGARCRVRIDASSQFASALLLAATRGQWHVTVEGENAEESSYVRLTSEMIASFPQQAGTFAVEPDASSASYFWGAGWALGKRAATRSSRIRVADWMQHSWQIDARFPSILQSFPKTISRRQDLGDSIMTAIVLAPFADEPKTFVELGTAAGSGIRARSGAAHRIEKMRSEHYRRRRYASNNARPPARGRNRNV